MEGENIIKHPLEGEITQSYIDYSMSVIVSRALPDVRDGLKPVLRRILFAMNEMKMYHNTKFKKSAVVVGEVLGKYHPHGDSSVYEAMVRMAQPFSLRYPLVDGQGNFGSIDGDGAAAMRYTEARLTKIAQEMLIDIELDTVDWKDNYDNSRQEPISLPTKFPNHLCNGTMGIAVGMATNMAPHNLGEIIDASLLILNNPEASIDEIMKIVKGPDFPTGGTIFDPINIKQVYARGKGSITMRGKTHFEEKKGKNLIIIDEMPYQVNKANLVAKIGELVNQRKIEGIYDITDESSKDLIRVSIELTKGVKPENILTLLYKLTDLQTNFNLNNVVLIEKGIQPTILNIKDLISEFVTYRREVVLRRSKYLLAKAQDRLHILQGLKKAIDILDEVIATIRNSDTRSQAKDSLMSKYEFSDPQAEYILMLRLQTLVGLEIQKILDEIKEKEDLIAYLTKIISDPAELDRVVTDELTYIKNEYADPRRTEVSGDSSIYDLNSNVKSLQKLEELRKEDIILRIGNDFETKVLYQSRINIIPEETYALNYTDNQDKLFVISNTGELVVQRLKDLGSHNIKGSCFDFKKEFSLNGDIIFCNAISAGFDHIVMLTNQNNIKKVDKNMLLGFRKFPTMIMNLNPGEKIIQAIEIKEDENIGLVSKNGMLLIFPQKMVRTTGKTAGGIKAMDLDEGDTIANMFVYKDEMFIFVYSDNSGKLVAMEDCKLMKRAQKGLIAAQLNPGEKIRGGMSIDEGAVMLKLVNGEVINLHSNDMRLKNRITKLDPISTKTIDRIYRPWSEKTQKPKKNKEEDTDQE